MNELNNLVTDLTSLLKQGGPFFGVLLILLESIFPALPLGVFVALNINAFGLVFGIMMSWLATCLGCYLSFLLFRFISSKFMKNFLEKKKLQKILKRMKTIEFSNLVVIIALPFTPAFLINIAAGLVGLGKRKFLLALLIGKIFMITFWGCVGKSLLESITDIRTILIVSILIVFAYFLSKLVSKKMKIE